MKLLAVETATSCQSVAVLQDEQVLARSDVQVTAAHGKWLIPTIDRLLRSLELRVSDLDGFAVSIGPGSFTGLRVGLATLMGFRLVTGKPLAAVPTLEGLAWNLPHAQAVLCPALKARAGEVYWAHYQWSAEGVVQPVQPEQVGSVEAFAQSLAEGMIVLGEGWEVNREALVRLLKRRGVSVNEGPAKAMAASAVSVGQAGLARLRRGDVAPRGIAPRYIQRAEAELAWMARQGDPKPDRHDTKTRHA